MKLCSGCSACLLSELEKRGWNGMVRPERAAAFALHWLAGTARKDTIDPYVVAVLELNAQATKKAKVLPWWDVCPICWSEKVFRTQLRMKWVEGVLEQLVRPLLISNGLIEGFIVRKRGAIITDYSANSINGGPAAPGSH